MKPILQNSGEIADYISEISSDDIDIRALDEYFCGAYAKLELVNIDSLTNGNQNGNIRSSKKEKEYMKMPTETMPPIVVDDNEVIDGNHRFRVAKKKKLTQILAYVIYDKE